MSMNLTSVGQALTDHAPEIIGTAEQMGAQEPWMSLPRDLRLDHLVPLLRKLVAAAFDEVNGEAHVRELVDAAVEHGREREDQGFAESEILLEYQVVRDAVERFLLDRYGSEEWCWKALALVDVQITTATTASLLGLHSPSMDAERLQRGIERLVGRTLRPA